MKFCYQCIHYPICKNFVETLSTAKSKLGGACKEYLGFVERETADDCEFFAVPSPNSVDPPTPKPCLCVPWIDDDGEKQLTVIKGCPQHGAASGLPGKETR